MQFFLNFLDDSIEKTLCSSLCGPKVQAKPTDHTKPWSLGAKVSVTSSLPSRSWWRFTGAELGFFQKSGGFFKEFSLKKQLKLGEMIQFDVHIFLQMVW